MPLGEVIDVEERKLNLRHADTPPVQRILKYADPFMFLEPDPHSGLVASESDCLEYRLIELDNGLEVMLSCDPQASDPEDSEEEEEVLAADDDSEEESEDDDEPKARKAACSMAVGVGSFEDPDKCQGLAHFLEHMVFMGTKKYPGENQWESFLSKRGGEDNAYTDVENTTYYFSVRPQHLEEALDRFAQFFISPLFAENTAEREVQAIESEFQGVLQDEECRRSAVLCHTCSRMSPLRKFGWGNQKSLIQDVNSAGVNRQELMKEFHKRWYYAKNMKLYVFGSDLDSLEKWVRTSFSDIPSDPQVPLEPPKPIMCYINPLEPGFKKYYHISAVTDSFEITINWHLPTRFGDWQSKPWHFIQELVGHEGTGSLLVNLRREGLAIELSANADPEMGELWNKFGIIFSVQVEVTEQGYQQKELVIQKVFEYFDMLRNNKMYFQEKWKELQYLAGIRFHKMDRKDPVDKASEVATYMLKYTGPKQWLLCAPHLQFEYNHELTCEMLDFLTADLSRIDILRKGTGGNIKEPWFGVDYSVEQIDDDVFERWKNATNANNIFHMPSQNLFIPGNFDIHKASEPSDTEVGIICDDQFGRIFHKLDDNFQVPKTEYRMYLEHCDAYTSIEAMVSLDIYCELFSFLMEEQMYPAYIAGIKYDYVMGTYGLYITLRGFSEHMDSVFLTILERYVALAHETTPQLFDIQLKKHLRQLRNTNFELDDHDLHLRDSHLSHLNFSTRDRIKCAENMTFELFEATVKHILRNIFLRGLIHGNCTRENAIKIIGDARKILAPSRLFSGDHTNYRLIKIPPNCMPIIERKVVNPEESNSFVCMRYQIGPATPERYAYLDLLNHIAYEPFFDELRTKQQLGYSVWSSFEFLRGLGFMTYNVQSSTYHPKEIRGRIEEFVNKSFLQTLVDMSDEDFSTQKDSLIEQKKAPFNNMKELTSELYWEIKSQTFLWNRREIDVKNLELITKQKFIDYYRKYILDDGPHKRRLLTMIYGKDHEMPNRGPDELLTTKIAENYMDPESIFAGQEFIIDDRNLWKDCCETWPQYNRRFVPKQLPNGKEKEDGF